LHIFSFELKSMLDAHQKEIYDKKLLYYSKRNKITFVRMVKRKTKLKLSHFSESK